MVWKYCEVREIIKIKRIYTMFERECDYGYDFSGESHDFWECVYVARGSVCVSADERIYNLTEGQIIFHKPLELHKFFVDNKSGATLYIFSYMPEGDIANRMADKVCRLNDDQKEIINKIFIISKNEADTLTVKKFSGRFNNRIDIFEQKPVSAQIITSYICQLILLLAKESYICNTVNTYDARLFQKAVDRMNDCVYTSLSVPELARYLGTSESTLKRVFDKYAKLSVYKYFLLLKIKNATSLLQSGMSVNETAEKLGFSSQGYFSACYKRETGINPSQLSKSK